MSFEKNTTELNESTDFYGKLKQTNAASLVKAVRKAGVVGQNDFVKTFAQQICLQTARISSYRDGTPESCLPRCSGLLVVGPTASGKSFIIRKFAEALSIEDVLSIDCSKMTGEGWKGASLSAHLERIAEVQKKHPHTPVLVVWDEVDKLVKNSGYGRDGFDPQKDFLVYLDGGVYEAQSNNDKNSCFTVDTNYVINVFAGAFTGIEDDVRARLAKGGKFGFGAAADAFEAATTEDDGLRLRINSTDLMQYGLMREFVGRMSAIVLIRALPRRQLVSIIKNSPNSLQACFQKILPQGVRFRITETAADLLAQKALESGVGARALEQNVGPFVAQAREEAMTNTSISGVILDTVNSELTLKFQKEKGYVRKSSHKNRAACETVRFDKQLERKVQRKKDGIQVYDALQQLYPQNLDDMVAMEGGVSSLAETLIEGHHADAASDTDAHNARLLTSSCIAFVLQVGAEHEHSLATVYKVLRLSSPGCEESCFELMLRALAKGERYDKRFKEWVPDINSSARPDAEALKYQAMFTALGLSFQERAWELAMAEFERIAKGDRTSRLVQRFLENDDVFDAAPNDFLFEKARSTTFRNMPPRTFDEAAHDLCISPTGLLGFAKDAYTAEYLDAKQDSECRERTVLAFARSILTPSDRGISHHARCNICGRFFHRDFLEGDVCVECRKKSSEKE